MLDPSILSGHGALPSHDVAPLVLPTVSSRANDDSEDNAQTLAAVVELQSALDRFETVKEAAQHSASQIRDHFGADRVFVLWRSRPGTAIQLIGDSLNQGGEGIEADTEAMVVAAGEEIAARDFQTCFPTDDPLQRHALLAVAQLARHLPITKLDAVRLTDHVDQDRGTLIVVHSDRRACNKFLAAASCPLASSLARIERTQPGRVERVIGHVQLLLSGRRRTAFIVVGILIAALMCVPTRYRVAANVELQPVQRRFIAVPFDGPLKRVSVQPGDVVEAGKLLAEINPREIEYELASSLAELARAEQERKSMIADHDFAGGKLASLEVERLRNQTQLLEHQKNNLEIRSPIAGVVVSGDLSQSEGMPMSRGETLFEISPLGEMMAQVAVPESELAEVRVGMTCRFSLHAYPNRGLEGSIEKVHPSAELRDQQNVFIAEVRVQDPEGLYRPGMRGRARISGEQHPLGWNLFHHAYHSLVRGIGW